MIDPVRELKVRAEILHGRIDERDPAALKRLRALPEHRRATDEALVAAAPDVQRKHCLAVVARELGFDGWPHALRVLGQEAGEAATADDFGTALYTRGCAAYLNHWYVDYAEARALREEIGGYLLAYKRQFLIVARPFIETLGLDPDDPDWAALGYDWARPRDPAARRRLYGKLLAAQA